MALSINKFRTYFLYGAPPYQDIVQFADTTTIIEEIVDFAVNEEFKNAFDSAFPGKVIPFDIYDRDWRDIPQDSNYPQYWIPNFFTLHYREFHRPYYIDYENRETVLQKDHLNQSQLFKSHPLDTDVRIKWDFIMAMETCPIIYVMVETTEPIDTEIAYRLSSLHLSREQLIPKNLFSNLFVNDALIPHSQADETTKRHHKYDPIDKREFITLEELVSSIQYTLYIQARFTEKLAKTPLEAIVHVPFSAVEINQGFASQEAFVKQHRSDIVKLISRPYTYEFDSASELHEVEVLENTRIWSVSKDAYFVIAYSGALYIKLNSFDTSPKEAISNYRLASEYSVFHSFRLSIANYYILRLVDAELDEAIVHLKTQIEEHRQKIKNLYSKGNSDDIETLTSLNELVIHVSDLRFKFIDLLEELDNSDKLIDEEWHIDLLDKINQAFGMHGWRDSIKARLDNLTELVHVLETSYERFLNLNASLESRESEKRLFYVTLIFSAFAGAEVLGLLFAVVLGEDDQLYIWVKNHLPPILEGYSHLFAALFVIIMIIMIAMLSLVLARFIYNITHSYNKRRN